MNATFDRLAALSSLDRLNAMIDSLADEANDLADAYANRAPEGEGAFQTAQGFFLVRKAKGSGNLYAMRLLAGQRPEYVRGAIYGIREADRMTLVQAKAAGVATGYCMKCARFLSDPVSVENGIGPVCAKVKDYFRLG